MMGFHEKVIALALLQAGTTPLGAAFTMQKAGILTEIDTIQLVREIEKFSVRNKVIGMMILEKRNSAWTLESADRVVCITEEFLATCSPDWADELRTAMAETA